MIGALHSASVIVPSAALPREAVAPADSLPIAPPPSAVAHAPLTGGGSLLSPATIVTVQTENGGNCGSDGSCSDSDKKGLKDGVDTAADKDKKAGDKKAQDKKSSKKNGELSDDEKAQVEKLKARDREVRAHEHAHASAGGNLAGAPSYSYQKGPDGQQYAIGGEVKIDASPVKNDPEATISKMQRVIAAALAPAQPSGQDRSVAAQARAQLAQAQVEALKKDPAKQAGNAPADQSPGSGLDKTPGPQPSDQPILSLIA